MSDSITITGTVHRVLPTEKFATGFEKRVLVVETEDGKYPQTIPIEFVKDKTSLLDRLRVGQSVSVQANLRGNEYNGKFYCNIQGWRIEAGESDSAAVPDSPPSDSGSEEDMSDVPF